MIPHNRPTLGIEEEAAALAVLRTKWLSLGPETEKFEDDFCAFLGLPKGHAVAVSSGTAALYLALWVLNGENKRIAMPSYVCSALQNAVAMIGGQAIFIDSQEDSPNVNLNQINEAAPDIAIVPHLYGIPQTLSPIGNKIKVIEDCAQALGASVKGIPAGLQGDIGIYSFYATKLMTSGGQGGMVVSKDRSIIELIKDYRLYDQRRDKKNRFNFQMTDLQAAIGRAQLKKFPHFLKRREEIFQQYKKIGLPLLDAPIDINPVRFRAILITDKPNEILDILDKAQIKSVIPLMEGDLLETDKKHRNALEWTKKTVSIPIYPSLTDEEVKKICLSIPEEFCVAGKFHRN